MTFDWKEYLNLAENLPNFNGSGVSKETLLRTAISRAYYAAFCYARNFERDKRKYSPAYLASDHGNLKKYLRDRGRPDIAKNLDDLKQWRNNCDYEDDLSNPKNNIDNPASNNSAIDIDTMFASAIKCSRAVFTKLS